MTGAEFLELQKYAVPTVPTVPTVKEVQSNSSPALVYGLRGLRELLNVSHVTACRIKQSEALKGTFSQAGRKIVFDRDAVLKALGREI